MSKKEDNPVPSIDFDKYRILFKDYIKNKRFKNDSPIFSHAIFLDEFDKFIIQLKQNGVETDNEQPKCHMRCDCEFFLKNLELCPECDQ